MSEMTLSEVCKELSVSRRTIQGYEQVGLLQPSGRNNRGWLLYDMECRERIKLIIFYQKIGLKRKEIRYLQEASPEIRRNILKRQRERIQKDVSEKNELVRAISELIDED